MILKSKAKVKLTARQEKFCQGIANGLSQSDAYRGAYSTKNKIEKSIWELASRLAKNIKVKSRIKELKGVLVQKQLWTRADSVKILSEIAKGKKVLDGSKISAIRELNLMHGFDRFEDSESPNELALKMRGIALIMKEKMYGTANA